MNEIYKLYTDGSHRNLDNMAGFGGHIDDQLGNTISDFSEVIVDKNLFNHFEKLGLKRGLELCLEQGIKNLVCYTDDIQLVKCFNLVSNERHNIHNDEIITNIFSLIDQFETIHFNYLPRNQNKKADKLSHRAMDQLKAVIEHSVVEGGFTPSKLDFIEKHTDKLEFNKNAHNINNTIVIHTTQDKDVINVYLVKKDIESQVMTSQLIKSHIALNKPTNIVLDILNKTLLDYSYLKNCAFFMEGIKGDELQRILKGYIVPSKKLKEKLELFEEVSQNFDSLTYYRDKKVLQVIAIPSKEQIVTGPKNKDFFLLALTELGKDDYYIGKNKLIENTIPIKNSKKNSIAEIQKLYFAHYLKMYVDTVRDQYNVPIRRNRKEVLVEVKEHLTNQGVKLRM